MGHNTFIVFIFKPTQPTPCFAFPSFTIGNVLVLIGHWVAHKLVSYTRVSVDFQLAGETWCLLGNHFPGGVGIPHLGVSYQLSV